MRQLLQTGFPRIDQILGNPKVPSTSTITHKTSQIPPLQATGVKLISKKHRKKSSIKRWMIGCIDYIFKTIVLIAIMSGGNHYQITATIQLYTQHNEAQNPTTLSKRHYS